MYVKLPLKLDIGNSLNSAAKRGLKNIRFDTLVIFAGLFWTIQWVSSQIPTVDGFTFSHTSFLTSHSFEVLR